MSNHELRVIPPPRTETDALRQDACASAVAQERERIAEGLYDTVIHRLFAAGPSQSCAKRSSRCRKAGVTSYCVDGQIQ